MDADCSFCAVWFLYCNGNRIERAFIAEISPADLKGTMLGLHSTLVGVALLPASLIAGMLWDTVGAAAPFVLGASLSVCAAVLLGIFFKVPKENV